MSRCCELVVEDYFTLSILYRHISFFFLKVSKPRRIQLYFISHIAFIQDNLTEILFCDILHVLPRNYNPWIFLQSKTCILRDAKILS